jgi:hypothetical protein
MKLNGLCPPVIAVCRKHLVLLWGPAVCGSTLKGANSPILFVISISFGKRSQKVGQNLPNSNKYVDKIIKL